MKILLTSGGSGGHLFPALSVLEELTQAPGSHILFVTTKKPSDKKAVEKYTSAVKSITAGPMPTKVELGLLVFLFKFIAGFFQSLAIMARFKPDVVAGFGGYVCGPVVIAAKFLRRPVLIHEQNVYPGRANKLVARYADKIALSFKETQSYLGKADVFLSGNPIREEFAATDRREARKILGIEEGEFNILIMGGSQGSHRINMAAVEAIQELKKTFSNICVTHMTGKDDQQLVKQRYIQMGMPHHVHAFLEYIWFAVKAADLVVSRCGASSITEFAACSLPAILVPYPYALAHQMHNAKALEKNGACLVINDSELSGAILAQKITGLMSDRQALARMGENIRAFYNADSGRLIAREILNLGVENK